MCLHTVTVNVNNLNIILLYLLCICIQDKLHLYYGADIGPSPYRALKNTLYAHSRITFEMSLMPRKKMRKKLEEMSCRTESSHLIIYSDCNACGVSVLSNVYFRNKFVVRVMKSGPVIKIYGPFPFFLPSPLSLSLTLFFF